MTPEKPKEMLIFDTDKALQMKAETPPETFKQAPKTTEEAVLMQAVKNVEAQQGKSGQKRGFYEGKLFVLEGNLFRVKQVRKKDIVLRIVKS